MTSKNYRAPILYYIMLCASFKSYWWIQTWVTVRKPSIWVKIGDFLSSLTLKFDVWPWKIIEHHFYGASSFVHHFIAISVFKLELQSRNAQFGSKFMSFFVPCDFEIWQVILKKGHLFYATSSFVHHFVAIDGFKLELQSENAQFGSK